MKKLVAFLLGSWRISIWLVVTGVLMTAVMSWSNGWSMGTTLYVGVLTVLIWLFLWLGNGYLSNWLDSQYSWQDQPWARFVAGIIGMLVYSVGIVYLLIIFFRNVLGFDPGNDLNDMFFSTLVITTIITMFMTSRAFLFNWRQAAVDAEKLRRESVKAQYETLRSQVNPHFLFNSLNALTNLVHRNPDEAVRFIKQLSEVYRYVLDTRDRELVAVEEELRFLDSYLFLQRIRFGDKLKLDVRTEGVTGQVAPLAIQMLVENAIKHNVIADDRPLAVSLFARDGYVWVSNTLQRKAALPDAVGGIGLDNVRKRYGFLSNRPVVITETHGQFEVGLPVIPT
jgi:Histidine kinase